MNNNFYSSNARDYQVGDIVKDRQSNDIGVIQKIINIGKVAGTVTIVVYLFKKGYVRDYTPDILNLVSRAKDIGLGIVKTLNQKGFRNPRPTHTKPSDEEILKKANGVFKSKKTSTITLERNKIFSAEPTNNLTINIGRELKKQINDIYGKPSNLIESKNRIAIRRLLFEEAKLQNPNSITIDSLFRLPGRLSIEQSYMRALTDDLSWNSQTIENWLSSALATRLSRINKLKGYQRAFENFYSGKEYVPSMKELILSGLQEAQNLNLSQAVLGFRNAIGDESLLNSVPLNTNLHPRRAAILEASRAMSEAFGSHIKGLENEFSNTSNIIEQFLNQTSPFGYRSINDLTRSGFGVGAFWENNALDTEDIDPQGYGLQGWFTREEWKSHVQAQRLLTRDNIINKTVGKRSTRSSLTISEAHELLTNPRSFENQSFIYNPLNLVFNIDKINLDSDNFEAEVSPFIANFKGGKIFLSNPNNLTSEDQIYGLIDNIFKPQENEVIKEAKVERVFDRVFRFNQSKETYSINQVISKLKLDKPSTSSFVNKVLAEVKSTAINPEDEEDLIQDIIVTAHDILTGSGGEFVNLTTLGSPEATSPGTLSHKLKTLVVKRIQTKKVRGISETLSLNQMLSTESGTEKVEMLGGYIDPTNQIISKLSKREQSIKKFLANRAANRTTRITGIDQSFIDIFLAAPTEEEISELRIQAIKDKRILKKLAFMEEAKEYAETNILNTISTLRQTGGEESARQMLNLMLARKLGGSVAFNIDEEGKVFFNIGSAAEVNRLRTLLGEEAFETGINGSTQGILVNTESGNLIATGKSIEGIIGKTFGKPAKDKGLRASAGREPTTGASNILAGFDPGFNEVFVEQDTGIGFAGSRSGPYSMGYGSLRANSKFIDEERLISKVIRDPETMLPVWQLPGENRYIGFGLGDNPANQVKMLAENPELLFIDIESFGHNYSNLGQVGITKGTWNASKSQMEKESLLNLTNKEWLNKNYMDDFKINSILKSGTEFMDDELSAIERVAEIIKQHPNAAIVAYNESADIGKMASIARAKLAMKRTDIMTSSFTESEKQLLLNRITEAQLNISLLSEVQSSRLVNAMFLETAIDPELGIPSLLTTAMKAGITTKQTHTALEDTALLAEVVEKRISQYQAIDFSSWKQLTLGAAQKIIALGRKFRVKDYLGRDLDGLDLANRILRIIGVRESIDPYTEGLRTDLVFSDFTGNSERILNTSNAAFLAGDLSNLTPIGSIEDPNIVSVVERHEKAIARDLANRRVERLYKGEPGRSEGAQLELENFEWRYKLATGTEEERENLISLAKSGDINAQKKVDWMNRYLDPDPRMKRQFSELKSFYENQYSRYDKPFFDEVNKLIQTGMTRDQAALLVKNRFERVYGKSGLYPIERTYRIVPPGIALVQPILDVPGMSNLHSISLRDPVTTRRELESFVVNTFYRAYDNKAINKQYTKAILIEALGNNASNSEINRFLSTGSFSESRKIVLNTLLAEHAIRENINITSKTKISDFLIGETGISDTLDLTIDPLGVLSKAIRSSALGNTKTGGGLSGRVLGTNFLHLINRRKFDGKNRKFARNIKSLDQEILEEVTNGRFQSFLDKREEDLLKGTTREAKDFQKKILSFKDDNIPSYFREGKYIPSIMNLTPEEVINLNPNNKAGGYKVLAKLLTREEEVKEKFLTTRQRKEIKNLLGWQNQKKALEGVSLGKIRSKPTIDGLVSAADWVIPTNQGEPLRLGDFVKGKTKTEFIQSLQRNELTNLYFRKFAEKYYGDVEDIAPLTTPSVFKKSSIAQETIKAVEEEIHNAVPKGPSVAQSAISYADTAVKLPGGSARNLGKVLSGIIPDNLDDLSGKIKTMLDNPIGLLAITAGLVGLGLSARKPNLDKKSYVSEEQEQTSEYLKDKTIFNQEIPQNFRIKASIRGKTLDNVDSAEIVNSIHTAIDLHMTTQAEKSHSVQDNRQNINKRVAQNYVSKLLKR